MTTEYWIKSMIKSTIKAYLVVIATGLILFTACAEDEPLEPLQVGSNPDLTAHSAEFKQEVIDRRFNRLERSGDRFSQSGISADKRCG